MKWLIPYLICQNRDDGPGPLTPTAASAVLHPLPPTPPKTALLISVETSVSALGDPNPHERREPTWREWVATPLPLGTVCISAPAPPQSMDDLRKSQVSSTHVASGQVISPLLSTRSLPLNLPPQRNPGTSVVIAGQEFCTWKGRPEGPEQYRLFPRVTKMPREPSRGGPGD